MSQNYYKRNYKDALNYLIPQVYFETEVETSGMGVSQTDNIINTHINFCINQPSLLNISAVGEFSSINTVSGLSRWFINTNDTAEQLNVVDFETNVLHKLGLCTGEVAGNPCVSFNCSSGDCGGGFSGTPYNKLLSFFKEKFLPKVTLNSSSLAETTLNSFATTPSGTHNYLINKLGWAYFLNTSADNVAPSGFVASALTDMYMSGINFSVNTGVKGLTDYLWRNWTTLSSVSPGLISPEYLSGAAEYTSGTQGLDRLTTLVDIIYPDLTFNEEDSYVEDAFVDYIDNGFFLDTLERKGPLSKFVEGVSYSIYDTNNDSERLKYLYSLERCPDHLLKYVAELIGWQLRGSNPKGWRRQLSYAVILYKQKGTKEGLYNAITTVLPGTSMETSAIEELYESYIPFLMYYLLNTDSTLFSSFTSWTPTQALLYTSGEYSYSDMDLNIRVAIDYILLRAVQKYNDSFYVRNFKFDLENPEFVFEYRDRSFPIPPWEEIKFYKSCDVTTDLLKFLEDELICLGVSRTNARKFNQYVTSHTISNTDTDMFSNAFLFFTSSINIAPNESDITQSLEVDKFDYLSLWSGKSSTFNVNVSSGPFASEFFNTSIYSSEEFFKSLSIIDEFSPAKSMPRPHVDLVDTDYSRITGYNCPTVRYWMQDRAVSGFQGGSASAGMNIASIPGAVGGDYPTPTHSSRGANDHTYLPVFKRSFVDSPIDFAQLDGSSLSAAPTSSNVFRTTMRRRNFSNNLEKGGRYSRTGFSMPSYFNVSSEGSDTDYYPLGFNIDQYRFTPVFNFKDLYEVSSWPYDDAVWSPCYGLDSLFTYSGIPVSSTFDCRGSTQLTKSSCDNYARRDRQPEFTLFLHNLLDKKYTKEAERIYEVNKFLIDTSSFINPVESIINSLWNSNTVSMDTYYNSILGKRIFSIGSIDGMHKLFKDYISYFTNTGIGNGLLETYKDGGANILSHTYGPLFLNGYFTIDGSAVSVDPKLISTGISEVSSYTIPQLSSLGNITITSVDDMPVEGNEVRNPYVLSGVELVDLSSGSTKFSVYNLDASNSAPTRDNYNIDNPIVVIDSLGHFPRMRFNLKDYGEFENFILPDRDYTFSLNAAVGNLNTKTLGGGSFGVWIHTDVESDSVGNKVFWNFMPNGEWNMLDANILQSKGAVNLVKNSLSHYLDYSTLHEVVSTDECFVESNNKDIIKILQKSDFTSRSVTFNTNNPTLKLSLPYYQSHNQVHRNSQNYIVEVFLNTNSNPDKYSIFDNISVIDERQYSRTSVKHPIHYNTYKLSETIPSTYFVYYDSLGVAIPEGTQLSAGPEGDIVTEGGDKVTVHADESLNVGKLYSQLTLISDGRWVKDDLITTYQIKSTTYDGLFTIGTDGQPEILTKDSIIKSITIVGKTLGSHIQINELLDVPLDPEEVLIMLREFKRLQAESASRNKAISAAEYGPEGGSRLNYRDAPMWGNGSVLFEQSARQYTKVRVEN